MTHQEYRDTGRTGLNMTVFSSLTSIVVLRKVFLGVLFSLLIVGMTGCLEKWFGGKPAAETGDVEMVSAEVGMPKPESEATPATTEASSESSDQTAPSSTGVASAPVLAAPPPVSLAEVEALKREVDSLRESNETQKGEIQVLKAKITEMEQAGVTAQESIQKVEASAQKQEKEAAKLKLEIERLSHLDYNEYARLVELTHKAPEEAVKAWPIFIDQFPSSPLTKEAREQCRNAERALRQKQKQGPFKNGSVFTDREPIVR